MERELLLLGLLRIDEMHGYQLNEFIDSHFGVVMNLKRPTAYRLLNKMADEGWVSTREERKGNRPPRRVFAITPEGEAAFQQLLRESLAKYEPVVPPGDIGLLFLQALPPDEAKALLQTRRASVEAALELVQAHKVDERSSWPLLHHQARHLTAEIEWLSEVITRLASQETGS